MTANTLTVEIRDVDTEPLLDNNCMALLFGVTLEDINALPASDGVIHIPREWVQRGRRRSNEAQAHTGSDFILDILNYWAQKDHNAVLEVAYV